MLLLCVDISAHFELATDGTKSDLESRILSYAETKGGISKLNVKDDKVAQWLNVSKSTPAKTAEKEEATPPKTSSRTSKAAKKSATEEVKKAEIDWPALKEQTLAFLSELQQKLSSVYTVVGIFLLAEFFSLVLSQVGWQRPFYVISINDVCSSVLGGTTTNACLNLRTITTRFLGGPAIKLSLPSFAGFLSYSGFWSPLFNWLVYFVLTPAAAGYFIKIRNSNAFINAVSLLVSLLSDFYFSMCFPSQDCWFLLLPC